MFTIKGVYFRIDTHTVRSVEKFIRFIGLSGQVENNGDNQIDRQIVTYNEIR